MNVGHPQSDRKTIGNCVVPEKSVSRMSSAPMQPARGVRSEVQVVATMVTPPHMVTPHAPALVKVEQYCGTSTWFEGARVGGGDGNAVGTIVGSRVGSDVGTPGSIVGVGVGRLVGLVGDAVGFAVGSGDGFVGLLVGAGVGAPGKYEGAGVGIIVGFAEGAGDGAVGSVVGDSVGVIGIMTMALGPSMSPVIRITPPQAVSPAHPSRMVKVWQGSDGGTVYVSCEQRPQPAGPLSLEANSLSAGGRELPNRRINWSPTQDWPGAKPPSRVFWQSPTVKVWPGQA